MKYLWPILCISILAGCCTAKDLPFRDSVKVYAQSLKEDTEPLVELQKRCQKGDQKACDQVSKSIERIQGTADKLANLK